MPRNTTAIASAYDRTRVHQCELIRGESQTFRAEFKGVIPSGVSVVSATWRCDRPQVAVMANATYDDTGTQIKLTAGYWGFAWLKAAVTLSDGSVLEQPVMFESRGGCSFDVTPPTGSTFLQATLSA